jgi:hypothetical protein
MHNAGDVRIENVPDSSIQQPTDAIIRVTRACICGSDLWPYILGPAPGGQRMGHEAIGVVEAVGSEVQTLKRGQVVIMPFASSDGTCMFCKEGLPTACVHIGFFGNGGAMEGAQAEALRIPQADGTLFALPVAEDDVLMPSLLTLSDVMGTGHHAAVTARVARGHSVAVVGDGAVGLCGALLPSDSAPSRSSSWAGMPTELHSPGNFGATDVVRGRGEEAVERVRELTGGFGVHSVLECVGTEQAIATSMAIARPGGAVGRVGVPHYQTVPAAEQMFFKNVNVAGGPAPTRAYISELLPDVMEGRIEPGRVFDRTVGLEGVSDGYRAMNERKALKVMIEP